MRAGGTRLRPPLPKTGGATPKLLPAKTRFFFFLRGCIAAAARVLLQPGVLLLLLVARQSSPQRCSRLVRCSAAVVFAIDALLRDLYAAFSPAAAAAPAC